MPNKGDKFCNKGWVGTGKDPCKYEKKLDCKVVINRMKQAYRYFMVYVCYIIYLEC